MPHDEDLARRLRDDLRDLQTVEKRMFGGIAFMHRGRMLCALHQGGGIFRVGRANEAEALAIDGVGPMDVTGRPMTGMVAVGPEVLADDTRRRRLVELSLAFNHAQPAGTDGPISKPRQPR